MPSVSRLKTYDVVVATCGCAGLLLAAGLRGHFTHVLVDEAAQALEPEALVPVSLAVAATRIAFFGDPHQLGPAVRSAAALRRGLGTSLLERLVQRAAIGGPGAPSVARLVANYRAHGALLSLPSRLFYDGAFARADVPPSPQTESSARDRSTVVRRTFATTMDRRRRSRGVDATRFLTQAP